MISRIIMTPYLQIIKVLLALIPEYSLPLPELAMLPMFMLAIFAMLELPMVLELAMVTRHMAMVATVPSMMMTMSQLVCSIPSCSRRCTTGYKCAHMRTVACK